MGGINPIGLVTTGLGILNTGTQLASQFGLVDSPAQRDLKAEQNLALEQLQARQALQQQQINADTALEREKIAAGAKAAEDERRSALRRAVARQKAQFGASGIAGTGGSSEAVLLGLFDESDEELASREKLDALRNKALDLDVASSQSLNVLQRAQLQQRQGFERELTGFRFF